jgi:hypothetical protein
MGFDGAEIASLHRLCIGKLLTTLYIGSHTYVTHLGRLHIQPILALNILQVLTKRPTILCYVLRISYKYGSVTALQQ